MAEQPSQGIDNLCPFCHSKQLGPSQMCWRCEKPLDESPDHKSQVAKSPVTEPLAERWSASMPAPTDMGPPPSERLSFSLGTMFWLMTIASVCLALFALHPGLGIFACIIGTPVFLRTTKVVRHREQLGGHVSVVEKATLFLGSFAMGSVLVVLSLVGAFCGLCGGFMVLVASVDDHDMLPIAGGFCVGGIVAVVGAVALGKWMRTRYRQEMDIKQVVERPRDEGG